MFLLNVSGVRATRGWGGAMKLNPIIIKKKNRRGGARWQVIKEEAHPNENFRKFVSDGIQTRVADCATATPTIRTTSYPLILHIYGHHTRLVELISLDKVYLRSNKIEKIMIMLKEKIALGARKLESCFKQN